MDDFQENILQKIVQVVHGDYIGDKNALDQSDRIEWAYHPERLNWLWLADALSPQRVCHIKELPNLLRISII